MFIKCKDMLSGLAANLPGISAVYCEAPPPSPDVAPIPFVEANEGAGNDFEEPDDWDDDEGNDDRQDGGGGGTDGADDADDKDDDEEDDEDDAAIAVDSSDTSSTEAESSTDADTDADDLEMEDGAVGPPHVVVPVEPPVVEPVVPGRWSMASLPANYFQILQQRLDTELVIQPYVVIEYDYLCAFDINNLDRM